MVELPERVRTVVGSVFDERESNGCACTPEFEDDTLVVDARECPGDGRIESVPECRETVITALMGRDAQAIRTKTDGLVRAYEDAAAAKLLAAGRFAEAVSFHDARLCERTKRNPIAAAREATGRADAVSEIAAETGLAESTAEASEVETLLAPFVGPIVSRWRVERAPPPDATLASVRDLDTGATVRRYERSSGREQYHLTPLESDLSAVELDVLGDAYERLARGTYEGGSRAPARAVRDVVSDRRDGGQIPDENELRVERVSTVLEKHAHGYGLLADLFADPNLSDAFVTAPAAANPLRVTVDGQSLATNVRLTDRGVAALSSRFRRESGRALSRADPTLDSQTQISDRRVRVAAVTDPTSDGTAFAFRAHDRTVWTVPALVENDTISARAAAVLSVAVERGRSVLLAGPRGAGKTTMLSALLWELPPAVRTVVIEDTPELPVAALQTTGRDVQSLQASTDSEELSPAETLRTALRLGDGALVVGEVRGEEASVLYEAMRVGAHSEAVLGTIHGDGGEDVYERVVNDLGVAPSSFGVTDLLVTLEQGKDGRRQVRCLESVRGGEPAAFEALFERTADGLVPTGQIERGESALVNSLADPAETYADVRDRLDRRERLLSNLAAQDRTSGRDVTDAHERR
ncbi:ATPase, T2SS/T4P/T4SS family [Halovenus marina]|uniref:ATPase, T2SS/T4P/T4SS family n=1 Tax=Halovenus marina TaxID=3396621 RepID=UPI003F5605F5